MSENKCVHLVSLLETKAESITKLTDNKSNFTLIFLVLYMTF